MLRHLLLMLRLCVAVCVRVCVCVRMRMDRREVLGHEEHWRSRMGVRERVRQQRHRIGHSKRVRKGGDRRPHLQHGLHVRRRRRATSEGDRRLRGRRSMRGPELRPGGAVNELSLLRCRLHRFRGRIHMR